MAYSSNGLFICQRKYTIDLLQDLRKEDSRPLPTPIEANHRLGADDNEALVDPGSYQRLVGKLIYLTHTRPDITYTVGVLSQFMHTPRVSHLHAAHRVLRFHKGTIGRGLLFRRHSILNLEVYRIMPGLLWIVALHPAIAHSWEVILLLSAARNKR